MITSSDFLTLVDYCDRMHLVHSALFSVLNRVHPSTDKYALEIELLIFDLLLNENQRLVNEFQQTVFMIGQSPVIEVNDNDQN